jgi:glycosyltransferase involved in cell wall biosynthesis
VDRLHLAQAVRFHSGLSEPELAFLYQNAVALVSPSLYEGFCLPALEAARSGCPVIVSELPIFRELLPRGGLFVDPLDVPAIADAMIQMARGSGGQSDGLERYEIQRLTEQYRSFYEQALASL